MRNEDEDRKLLDMLAQDMRQSPEGAVVTLVTVIAHDGETIEVRQAGVGYSVNSSLAMASTILSEASASIDRELAGAPDHIRALMLADKAKIECAIAALGMEGEPETAVVGNA